MRFSTFIYTLKQGIANIFRNKWYSLASIATIGACLLPDYVAVDQIHDPQRYQGTKSADQYSFNDKRKSYKEIRSAYVLHNINFFFSD